MTDKQIKNLILTGEGYRIEFKSALDKSLIDEVCAFANSSGGYILMGVGDDKTIKGIDTRSMFYTVIFRKKGLAGTTQKGLAETAQKGLVETTQKGLVKTAQKGLVETTQKGLAETTQKGLVETTQKGLAETTQKGLAETTQKGLAETTQKGLAETTQKGLAETTQKGLAETTQKGLVETTQKGLAGTTQKGLAETTQKGLVETAQKGLVETTHKKPIKKDESHSQDIFGVHVDQFRSIFGVNVLNTACLIYSNPHIKAQEIADKLSVTKRTAENYLAKLKSADYIVRVGSDKTGHWKIVKKRRKI